MRYNPGMRNESVIRAVVFHEGDWLVAQCLDVDIAAQAKNQEDLYEALGRLLVGRVKASEEMGREPFKDLPPAPKRYWDMFFAATSQTTTVLPLVPADEIHHALPSIELKAAA
jgi:hypothetical protein